MSIETTYPGVYIEELHSLSLAVSENPSAVPVFAADDANVRFQTATRISSWMDYLNKITAFDRENVLDVSMRTYFENGGGYCHIVPVGALQTEVPKLTDVTLLVAAGQNITSAVSVLCQTGKCLFAILDGPEDDIDPSPFLDSAEPQIQGSRAEARVGKVRSYEEVNTPYAAIYYPWLRSTWSGIDIPPSAAIAGVYCTVDLTRGVWKAPANVTLQGGVVPKFPVTDEMQGRFTKDGKAVNMIRVFSNGGTTVWGARTREDSGSWRYISVRRLFNTVERDIKAAMRRAMFEPNSQPTWEQTRGSITNYLYRLWQQGGLAGKTVDEAFFVDVGKDLTMTQEQIDAGLMIVKVGMAAVRPAEFIILQFTQEVAQ